MKVVGALQTVTLIHRPSVYTFDETRFSLHFKRVLTEADYLKVIAELGKEVTGIKNVRAVTAQSGTPEAMKDLKFITDLEKELIHIYNNMDKFADKISNGSGQMGYIDTLIKFRKPRAVEFKDA